MRPEGVAAALRETKRADRARKRISAAATMEDAEDAWCDFLNHAGNVYTKLRAACYGHPRDFGWFGKQLDERSSDPLLLYVHKARNCITHRLDATVEVAPAGIQTMLFKDRKLAIDYPAHLRPLPVTDELGNVYAVPDSHLDVPFGYMDAAFIAMLATHYFQELVKAATARLR